MRRRAFRLVLAFGSLAAFGLAGHAIVACADDDADGVLADPGDDGGDAGRTSGDGGAAPEDASTPDPRDAAPGVDAGPYTKDCPGKPPATQPGETCIGFGASESCSAACGRPYGFVCVDGGPPGFADCVRASENFLGQTYCCTVNACVHQPDRDAIDCAGVTGKPRRFQCPVGEDGGNLPPPSPACEETGSGASSAEKFYCCP